MDRKATARLRASQIRLIQWCEQVDWIRAQTLWSLWKAAGELEAKMSELAENNPPMPKGESCPKCGEEMVVKSGRLGPFFGCSQYPKCDGTRQIPAGHGSPGPSEEKEKDIQERVAKVAAFVREVGGLTAAEKLLAIYRQLAEA